MHRGRNVARKKEFNFLFSVYLCACSVVLCVINTGCLLIIGLTANA